MATSLDREIEHELQELRARGLWRSLPEPNERIDFASNDYLGLARHPEVIAAGQRALARFGAGGRAARLLGGGSGWDRELEQLVADWLGSEAALLLPSGFQANLALVCALVGSGDVVFCDALLHASLIDGARLSRARVFVHKHCDLEELEHGLRETRAARRRLVLTEGVFSMDGDRAPLPELAALCARYNAHLVVDEAHSLGLLGSQLQPGAGAWAEAEAAGADPSSLAARVITGGKALGVGGALIVSSTRVRELCINRARPFLFTTALPPAVVGSLMSAVHLARAAQAERTRVIGHAKVLASLLGLPPPGAAIVPYITGCNVAATELATRVAASGFDVRAVRPPTVPEGSSRLRLVCHSCNTEAEVLALAACLNPQEPGTSRPTEKARRAPSWIVVGTDTNVGKTVVSALLARWLARTTRVSYWKPIQTGSESDTQEVARLCDGRPVQLLPPLHHFPLPASPHAAALAAGECIALADLQQRWQRLRAATAGAMIVELAGGLLVPLNDSTTQADWIATLSAQIVLVARSGLGTLNHTLLSLEALRSRSLKVSALILVGAPHPTNEQYLREHAGVAAVYTLPLLEHLDGPNLESWLERVRPAQLSL